jgi:sugar lactone lactonase YvrE
MKSNPEQQWDVERLGITACSVGENPLWHPMESSLYWCDIPNGLLLRYDPATSTESRLYVGEAVGGFTIQANGDLLLFMERGKVAIWRRDHLRIIISELPDERTTRFNDVIADPVGRVLCGTMSTPERKGRLYRLDTDGSIHVLLENVGCSNGMAFSLDRKHLFYTDSEAREIYRFAYEAATGTLSERIVFARVSDGEGLPDGATMDAEGYLWSARWDGGCIARYAEDGTIERTILVPARKAASLTFGGPGLNDIYITTANLEDPDPNAGFLYRCHTGIRGVPEFYSRIAFP